MKNEYFSRRAFLLALSSMAATIGLGFTTIEQSGLFPGDPAVDARKNVYAREQLRGQSYEGIITAADGTPFTQASQEGYPAMVLDNSYANICGYRSKSFGLTGLRKLYENELCYAEKAHGYGSTLTTTINSSLQKEAYRLTAGYRSSVILLDVDSGAVITLADRPSETVEFNANGITAEKMAEYNSQPNFWYPASTTCCLQPGSVQKVVDAAAIISSGIPQEYTDTGTSQTGIQNAGHSVYGDMGLKTMLVKSVNTYAADMTPRVGSECFSRTLEEFYYNKSIELDWGATLNPRITFDPDDIGGWSQLCIGQGAVQTSPLHMALMLGSVLHPEGGMLQPFMVREITRESGLVVHHEDGGNSLSTALPDDVVRQQLLQALAETAAGYHLSVPGGIVVAKTGTATKENSDRANVFLAFALQSPSGRRFAGAISRENVDGSSNQLKPLAAEFIQCILEEEENII